MKRGVQKLVRQVQANLTDELRKPKYRGHPDPMTGHCYVAPEALYHLLGGKAGGWRPMHVRHEDEPHWFLVSDKGDVVDATATQFATPVPVHLARGKGFLTKQPSKRAQTVMKRVRRNAKPNPRPVPIDRSRIYSIADALTDKILAALKSGGDTDDPYPSGVLAVLEDVDLPVVPTAGPRDVEFEEDWSPPARRRTPKRRTPYSTVKADVWAIGAPNESTRWKLTGHFSASAPDDYPKGYMPFALDVSIKLPGKVEKKHWIDNPQALRDEVRRVLLHEVTHFARAPWIKRSRSPTFPVLDTEEKICAYYNEPEEVEARAQEIAAQCITTARQMRRYAKLSMQALLGMSDTYNNIAWCLTDKNHRIIVQKVYRALDEEGLAPTRGKESVVRKDNPAWADKILVRNKALIEKEASEAGFLTPGRYGETKTFEELGCGLYGCVYPTKGGSKVVFKITSDPDEIRFVKSAMAIGEWPEGIVRYYKMVPLSGSFRKRPVVGIWREGAVQVGLPHFGRVATTDEFMLRKAHRLLLTFRDLASMVRNYAKRASKSIRNLRLGEQPDFDESLFIGNMYQENILVLAEMRKGRERARYAIHACKFAAELMVNEEMTYYIGEALLFYMAHGILLADVHNENVGQVKREENWNEPIWVITDPGHAVAIPPVWSYVVPEPEEHSAMVAANPTYEARLRKEYGVTDDPMLGGFLLPDGSFLDFSEGSGQRIQDHRNITWASTVSEKPHENRYDVMSRVAKKVGMYRWMPENWSLEMWTLPTPQQARMIESLAYDAPDGIIEIEAHRGKADYHHEYESWQAEDIVGDLKAFYGGRKPRRRNPTGDADVSAKEAEALRVVLAMAKVRKFKPSLKTPEAKQLVSAYFEAEGWRPDRYGNLLHPTKKDDRIHFSKQRVQRQAKIMGTWKNIRTYSPVDAARKLVVEAAKLENDAETLAAWAKGAQAKVRQKKTAAKRREKQSLRKKAAVAAMKQLAAENPRLVAVAGYGILLEKEDLDRMIARRDELVEAFMRDVEAGRELPGDDQFASVDKPPTAPLGYDVSYLWTETVDGVQYTVSVRYAHKGVAIVTIGSSSELGLIVDPRTHAMKPADYKPEGDAQISGQVMFNGDTFMGSLFLISAKQRRTGAGGRVLGLWCRMMKGYGVEAWRAEAVGPEGLAFLQAMQNRGCVEILGGQRSDLVVQCLNCGRKDNPVKKEEELPEGQYEIPSNKIQELERRIARFERKTKKLKLSDPIGAEIVGEKVRPVFDELGEKTGRVRVYKIVQIVGTAPRVGDHTFIARVQHTEAGNIVDRAPDTENVKLPKSLWAADATCDHCRLIRSRNETFVLRNDKTGKLIRVGRSCLADYLRSDDAAAALSLWSLMDDLRKMSRDIDEDGEGGYGSGRQFQDMVDYLARVVRAIEEQGWVSASRAREEGGTSTAGLADWSTFPLSSRATREDEKLHAALQPTPQAVAQAQKALAWARDLKPTSDYERNLQVVANLDYVPPKSAALAASMVAGYLRNQAKLVEKERAKKRAAEKVNEHFGEEGAQYCRALTVLRRIDIEGFYGTTRLYVMEDDEGRSFKWFASKLAYHPRYDWDNPNADANMEADDREERSLMPGDRLWLAFTIKKHDVWHNKKTDVREKQTIITRAAVHEDGCKSKWMDPETGQIFKTKKAMVAAQAKQNPTWRTPEVDAAIEKFVEALPPGQWVHVRVELRPGRKPRVVKVADLDGLADVMRVRRAGGIAVHKPKPFGKNNPTIKDARGRVLYVVPEPIENYL